MLFKKVDQYYPDYIKLDEDQKEFITKFKKLKLGEPFEPWTKRVIIPAAGVIACGWTKDNKAFIYSTGGYSVSDPSSGERIVRNRIEDSSSKSNVSDNNLEFYIEEIDENIKIFGISGGDGNYQTNDGWSLIRFSPTLIHEVIGIKKPYNRKKGNVGLLEDLQLIKLDRLEYFELKIGFSPNQKHFGIFGSGGAEIFTRE